MQAILQKEYGGVDTLFLGHSDKPEPLAGQFRIQVFAVGVNRADIVQRQGFYPAPPGSSPILGLEVAGIIDAIGAPNADFAVGDAVFGLMTGGAYAEYAILDAGSAIPCPEGWDWAQSAAQAEAWITAWLNLVEIGKLAAGEVALIHAGASSIGIATIQLAKMLGAKVIATCSENKAKFCRDFGADQVISRQDPDFLQQIAALNIDFVLDAIGAPYATAHLKALNTGGRWVQIGVMGGRKAEIDFSKILSKRIEIRGSTLRSLSDRQKAHLTRAFRRHLLPLLQTGALKMPIAAVFPWQNVAQAHQFLEDNKNCGKVVLRVRD